MQSGNRGPALRYCLWVEIRNPGDVHGLNSESRLRNPAIKPILNIISAVFHGIKSFEILIRSVMSSGLHGH